MLRQTTRQLVNKTTSEAVVGTTESRNYGWGEAGSQLMARSSQPFYTFYTQSKPLAISLSTLSKRPFDSQRKS